MKLTESQLVALLGVARSVEDPNRIESMEIDGQKITDVASALHTARLTWDELVDLANSGETVELELPEPPSKKDSGGGFFGWIGDGIGAITDGVGNVVGGALDLVPAPVTAIVSDIVGDVQTTLVDKVDKLADGSFGDLTGLKAANNKMTEALEGNSHVVRESEVTVNLRGRGDFRTAVNVVDLRASLAIAQQEAAHIKASGLPIPHMLASSVYSASAAGASAFYVWQLEESARELGDEPLANALAASKKKMQAMGVFGSVPIWSSFASAKAMTASAENLTLLTKGVDIDAMVTIGRKVAA